MNISQKRTKHSSEFKAKVALAAIKNEETVADLSKRSSIHPTMVTK